MLPIVVSDGLLAGGSTYLIPRRCKARNFKRIEVRVANNHRVNHCYHKATEHDATTPTWNATLCSIRFLPRACTT